MEDLRSDRFDAADLVPSDDVAPPLPPEEPPGRPGGSPGARPLFWFAPWFFALATLVGVERVAMIAATSQGLGPHVQLAGFGVFLVVVAGFAIGGGWWFATNYRR